MKATNTYTYIWPWGKEMIRIPAYPTKAASKATKILSTKK